MAYDQNSTRTAGAISAFDLTPTLIIFLVSAVGGPTAFFSFYYQRKHQRLTAILEAFKILNTPEHRKARENVYKAYEKYEKGERDIFKAVRQDAAMVRADLDQIGMLVDKRLFPKKMFLKVYWNIVLICWKGLKDDIEQQRKNRDYPSYMYYFEKLNGMAYEHWKKKEKGTKLPKVFSQDTKNIDG